jgi:hypothetical protein
VDGLLIVKEFKHTPMNHDDRLKVVVQEQTVNYCGRELNILNYCTYLRVKQGEQKVLTTRQNTSDWLGVRVFREALKKDHLDKGVNFSLVVELQSLELQ